MALVPHGHGNRDINDILSSVTQHLERARGGGGLQAVMGTRVDPYLSTTPSHVRGSFIAAPPAHSH